MKPKKSGHEIGTLFQRIVEHTQPNYGAVMADWPMGTPNQLADDAKAGWDFRDFYVEEGFVGSSAITRIENAADQLTAKRSADGLFVFSSRVLGGSGRDHSAAGEAAVRAITRRRSSR